LASLYISYVSALRNNERSAIIREVSHITIVSGYSSGNNGLHSSFIGAYCAAFMLLKLQEWQHIIYSRKYGRTVAQSPSFKAEWLENEVWKRVEEIINDPNRLWVVIKHSIENLRLREADLNARIKPIDDRLAEIAEQKARLADDWVIRHMNNDKFRELKGNLDREEIRIRALKAQIDPAQLEELESTKGVLRFWESQVKSMAWNAENEDGSMVRLVDKPHQVALRVVGFEDSVFSNTLGFPALKREMLNKLQMKLVVSNDRVEVNGMFPIEPINVQLCTSTRGG